MNNLIVLLLVLAVLIGIGLWLWPPPIPATPENRSPSWSPDGRRIAFNSSRDQNWEVYLLDVDTLEATKVTDNRAIDWDPTWGPAGDLVAFVSGRDARTNDASDIYTIHPLDRNVTRLTYRPRGWDGDPAWTPTPVVGEIVTGERSSSVAFASDRDGNIEVYSLSLDDYSVTRLTYRENTADRQPAPSPDGARIAFQSFVDGNWEIFVMDADGRNVKRVTFNPAEDTYPSWAPDGNKIAFTSTRDGNSEIYAMDVDGNNKRNLSANPAADQWPTWSPDSSMIAFQSNRTVGMEIWRMSASDGTGQKQLTGLE